MTSSQTAISPAHIIEDLTPTEAQIRASDPNFSVWVTASAGSGKTSVLVARILRLLLPSPDFSRAAVPPHRILAITYTRAAAAEMNLRIQGKLAAWATMPDKELREDVTNLIGQIPSDKFLNHARSLFANILEGPQALSIYTIHAFCQSVLGRFPLEADLPVGFDIIDDQQARSLLITSINELFLQSDNTELQKLISFLSPRLERESLIDVMVQIMSEPDKLNAWVFENDTWQNVLGRLSQRMPAIIDWASRINTHALRNILPDLNDNATNIKIAAAITPWLENPTEDNFQIFVDGVLTQKHEPKKPTGILKSNSDYAEIFSNCQNIALEWLDQKLLSEQLKNTAAILTLTYQCLRTYDAAKKHRAVLDYDDLITRTHTLLSKTSSRWIHFKLDQGIDHILLDEAQDTSPQQWDILRLLLDDFFDGHAIERPYGPRTLFVVGDPKQSIYSFRGADPQKFDSMRAYFKNRITESSQTDDVSVGPWRDMNFTRSFRTVPLILDVVDKSFDDDNQRRALGLNPNTPLRHISHRYNDGGCVEILKEFVIPKTEKEKDDDSGWIITLNKNPDQNELSTSQTTTSYARHIAQYIKNLIDKPYIIPARDRPVTAGDIIILFEKRNDLTNALIRSLKEYHVPVSGIDRLVLNDHIAVQDLLACARFAALTLDDMALACILKSPFVGLSEDDLFTLAAHRPKNMSLWDRVREQTPHIALWLEVIHINAHTQTPYTFFETILMNPAPCAVNNKSGLQALVGRLGQDALDPIQELLNLCLKLESQNIYDCAAFVTHLSRGRIEIKREMEEGKNNVRIMTIHAAKGLEAPVVIIPDALTVKNPVKGPQFIWDTPHSLPAPLWATNSKQQCRLFKTARLSAESLLLDEKSRLLYVALTRARDHVTIAGRRKESLGDKATLYAEQSWYHQTRRAALAINPQAITEDGDVVLTSTQKSKPNSDKNQYIEPTALPLPPWVHNRVTAEMLVIKRLRPSQMGTKTQGLSPEMALKQNRFMRGQITHKLFQLLPDYQSEQWHKIATGFVAKHRFDLDEATQKSIVDETLRILNDPVFAPVFGQGSQAEVPISGKVRDGVIISGQIDRLIILPDRILVVDFKTNRPSPSDIASIPDSYREQLQAYVTLLQRIYPDKRVEAALLWTDTPRLMPVIKA